MRTLPLSATLIDVSLLFACEAKSQDADPTESTSVGTAYEIHEWGLIRFRNAQGEVTTSGHNARLPQPYWGDDVPEKPLIYFHPLDGFDPATVISAEITITDGRVREVWPLVHPVAEEAVAEEEVQLRVLHSLLPSGPSYTWPTIQLLPGEACGVETVPTLTGFPCSALQDGGVCETAEMHSSLQPVPHCLTVGGTRAPVLLYNGYAAATTVSPVSIDRPGWSITNNSTDPIGPVWVRSIMRGSPMPHFVSVPAVAPGETVDLNALPLTDHAGMVREFKAALLARGLTEAEANDFVGAWTPDVLHPTNTPFDALGLHDQATTDRQYPLTLDPAPVAAHRVLAFTNE